ncbi:hypothetical protein VDGL01_07462 [Verticillium dahliae]
MFVGTTPKERSAARAIVSRCSRHAEWGVAQWHSEEDAQGEVLRKDGRKPIDTVASGGFGRFQRGCNMGRRTVKMRSRHDHDPDFGTRDWWKTGLGLALARGGFGETGVLNLAVIGGGAWSLVWGTVASASGVTCGGAKEEVHRILCLLVAVVKEKGTEIGVTPFHSVDCLDVLMLFGQPVG